MWVFQNKIMFYFKSISSNVIVFLLFELWFIIGFFFSVFFNEYRSFLFFQLIFNICLLSYSSFQIVLPSKWPASLMWGQCILRQLRGLSGARNWPVLSSYCPLLSDQFCFKSPHSLPPIASACVTLAKWSAGLTTRRAVAHCCQQPQASIGLIVLTDR